MPDKKICAHCEENKPSNMFYLSKMSKDGLRSWCIVCEKERAIKWNLSHNDITKASLKRWRIKHPEKYKAAIINSKAKKPEKYKELARKISKDHRGKDRNKLHKNMSCHVWFSLHGVKCYRKWENLTGYTTDQLKEHLEKQFNNGMTWGNYGQWHIDHKIPVAAFNFEKPEDVDFKRCWALSNLQPLWAVDNLKKHANLSKPFQPSLLL